MDINDELNKDLITKNLSERLEKVLESGDKMSKVLDGLEIRPTGNNVLVKPYVGNPYEKVEVRESGIILDCEAATFRNQDNGDEEKQNNGIVVARVIEVGSDCKYLKAGDDIYYYYGSSVPIPFFRQGFYCISEPRVLMVLNTDLQERYGK